MGTLLETKLHLPESSRDTVDRPRLLQYLNPGLHTRLTLICAPAGSGKTTIAADWLNLLFSQAGSGSQAVRIAWYTVDEHDNDLALFTGYVAAMIRRSCPELLVDWIDLERRTSAPEPEEVAAELLAALAPVAGHLLLALDYLYLVIAK